MPYKNTSKVAIMFVTLSCLVANRCQTINSKDIIEAEKKVQDLKEAENLFPDEWKRLNTLLLKLKFEYERGQKRKAQETLKEVELGISSLKEKLKTSPSPTPPSFPPPE